MSECAGFKAAIDAEDFPVGPPEFELWSSASHKVRPDLRVACEGFNENHLPPASSDLAGNKLGNRGKGQTCSGRGDCIALRNAFHGIEMDMSLQPICQSSCRPLDSGVGCSC